MYVVHSLGILDVCVSRQLPIAESNTFLSMVPTNLTREICGRSLALSTGNVARCVSCLRLPCSDHTVCRMERGIVAWLQATHVLEQSS